jgi:hypothetical protein
VNILLNHVVAVVGVVVEIINKTQTDFPTPQRRSMTVIICLGLSLYMIEV